MDCGRIMLDSPVLIEYFDKVTRIVLNRPEKLNALDLKTLNILYESLVTLNERGNDIRALIITGKDKAFSAGGDIKVFADYVSLDQGEEFIYQFSKMINDIIIEIREASYPVIAAINGVISGAGLNLASACDFRIAAHSARLQTAAYLRLGLIPASGGSYLLPTIIGPSKAWELLTISDIITAEQALDLGLISKVYSDDELQNEALILAQRLARGPTLAYSRTKALINNYISGSSLDHHLNLELRFQKEMARTYDFSEGVSAFLEKREAKFLGK